MKRQTIQFKNGPWAWIDIYSKKICVCTKFASRRERLPNMHSPQSAAFVFQEFERNQDTEMVKEKDFIFDLTKFAWREGNFFPHHTCGRLTVPREHKSGQNLFEFGYETGLVLPRGEAGGADPGWLCPIKRELPLYTSFFLKIMSGWRKWVFKDSLLGRRQEMGPVGGKIPTYSRTSGVLAIPFFSRAEPSLL